MSYLLFHEYGLIYGCEFTSTRIGPFSLKEAYMDEQPGPPESQRMSGGLLVVGERAYHSQ